MSDLSEILRKVEAEVQCVEDGDLRKIAFQELLRASLRNGAGDPASNQKAAEKEAQRTPKRRAGPTASLSSGVRPEVEALDLSPDESGLAPWGTLNLDWKKFCWILEASRLRNVDGLANAEISYLIERTFRESFAARTVNNLKTKIKAGMVKPVTVRSGEKNYAVWKILSAGSKEIGLASRVAAGVE